MRITAVRRWLAGTRVLVTFLRNGIRPGRRVAYCRRKESGDFAIGVDLSGQAPCHQGTRTESRRIARAHSDHSLAQGRWSEKRVELKFLLGEIRLFATRFSMFTLDAHFTDLLGNPEQAAMAIEQIPPTADGFPRAFPAGARSSAASVPPSRFDPVCANAIPALLHRDAVFV